MVNLESPYAASALKSFKTKRHCIGVFTYLLEKDNYK
jgi:hypothetical protein